MAFLLSLCILLQILIVSQFNKVFFASFLNNLDVFQQQPTVQLNTINGTLVNVPLCNETGIRCADDCLTLLV